MISTVPVFGSTPQTGTPKTNAERQELGQEQFLQLLVAQLRNQDPQSPLRPDEFAAQLAQFSTVEQLTKLNDVILAQTQSNALTQMMSQTQLSVSLIGRQVTALGDALVVANGGPTTVPIALGGAGGQARLTVLDPSGQEVASRDLGSLGPGHHTVAVPTLPDGAYTYRVDVTDRDGNTSRAVTYTVGVVDGVQFKNGSLILRVGKVDIPLEQLVEVKPAA